MAPQKKTAAARKRAPARPSRAASAVATAPRTGRPATGESGEEIRDELLRLIGEEVGEFVRVPNRKGTYERLMLEPGGKAFGYVFMPRPSGVQIRIHERFLHLAPKMPKFPFAQTAYGFWFTLKSKREAAKVAKAFRVAADDLRKDTGGES